MKKMWIGFVTLLLVSSLTYGYGAEIRNDTVVDQTDHVAVSPANTISGLTPKRSKVPVVLAQEPIRQVSTPDPFIPPAPTLHSNDNDLRLAEAQPVSVGNGGSIDAYIYAELERLSNDIQKIKKDTAKPDTKKAWSAPKINGRIFIDSVNFMDQKNTPANMQNAAGFRELRLGATGNGYDSFDYKVELGFQTSNGCANLIDNWIGAKNVPLLGYVRVGHFKPETGLYYPMGTTNISMMEYTASANIFGLSRKIGISSEHLFANERVRLFFGVFQGANRNESRYLLEDNPGQIVNIRLSMAPWYAQEGKRVLHLGGHWEYESLDSSANRLRSLSAKPGQFDWATATLGTGDSANDYSNRGGLEFAWQNGRYSARSELFAGSFNVDGGGAGKHLYGTYVELGYFLTDDFRSYDLKSGSFGGVKMKNNFHPFKCGEWNLVDGFGAWQAIFQWSYVDMEDWRNMAGNGGHQNDFVVGMSWFWTPQLRWVFEYVRSEQCVGTTYSHRSQDIFATSLRVHW